MIDLNQVPITEWKSRIPKLKIPAKEITDNSRKEYLQDVLDILSPVKHTAEDLEGVRLDTGDIGEGSFSKVRLGTHLVTGLKVAVKCIAKTTLVDSANASNLLRELALLGSLDHPNICPLLQVNLN